MVKKNGFTLIELIVVLVILTIVTLIATPIVLNLIEKVKIHSARSSVDAYGKSLENGVATYLLEHGSYPSSIDDLDIEYSGNKVECDVKNIYDNGAVYLTKCKVNNKYVLDNNGDNSYYYYGKRYGVYKIGDQVTYKGITFYVIEDSEEDKDYVKLLKAEPFTYNQVIQYAPSIIYDGSLVKKTGDIALIPYYIRQDGCNGTDNTLCNSEYLNSDIRKIVDLWQNEYLDIFDLVDDDNDTVYARLIKKQEFDGIDFPKFSWRRVCGGWCGYWTMTKVNQNNVYSIYAYKGGEPRIVSTVTSRISEGYSTIRPVIVLKKSAIK